MKIELLISYYEAKLNRLTLLVGDLQKMVDNCEVTRHINDELRMQIGEKDVCFDTLKFLKELNDKKD